MEQSFILRYHGGFSLHEQNTMTGEERLWYIKRINEEIKKHNDAIEKGSRGGPPSGGPPGMGGLT